MADQGRWFKLWITAPADDAMQELPPAIRWAWAAFGCYTKAHGTRGRVLVSRTNAVLAAEMGIDVADLVGTIQALPHVTVEGADTVRAHGQKSVNGTITVTWRNWTKYQEDSTQAARQRTSRSKKRREENKERTTPVVNPRGSDIPAAPESSGDSEGLSSLWEGDGRKRPGPDGMEGSEEPGPRNGRTRYPVEALVAGIATARTAVRARARHFAR